MATVKEAMNNGEPVLLFYGKEDIWNYDKQRYEKVDVPIIEIKKDKQFIHANKTNSRVSYSFDLSKGHFIKHKKGEEDTVIETKKITSWFNGADVITNDYKFALLILYNKYNRNFYRYRSIARFIEALSNEQSLYYEKWLGIGVDLEVTHKLEDLENDGSHVSERYDRWIDTIRVEPKDTDKFVINLIKNETNLSIDKLNDIVNNYSKERYELMQKINKYGTNPQYEHLFMVDSPRYYEHFQVNLLTDDRFNYERDRLYRIIEDYNLDVDRFIKYLEYLKTFEHTELDWVIRNYRDYLSAEKQLRGDRLSKMDKYPNNLVQQHHNRNAVLRDIQREKDALKEAENRAKEEIVYGNNKELYEEVSKHREFSIVAPETSDDIIEEGNRMNHCVGGYCSSIRNEETCIMFMRKSKRLDKEWVTVEIKDGKLYTALGKNNRKLYENEKLFLEKYADRKGLEYTAYAKIRGV